MRFNGGNCFCIRACLQDILFILPCWVCVRLHCIRVFFFFFFAIKPFRAHAKPHTYTNQAHLLNCQINPTILCVACTSSPTRAHTKRWKCSCNFSFFCCCLFVAFCRSWDHQYFSCCFPVLAIYVNCCSLLILRLHLLYCLVGSIALFRCRARQASDIVECKCDLICAFGCCDIRVYTPHNFCSILSHQALS